MNSRLPLKCINNVTLKSFLVFASLVATSRAQGQVFRLTVKTFPCITFAHTMASVHICGPLSPRARMHYDDYIYALRVGHIDVSAVFVASQALIHRTVFRLDIRIQIQS